MKLTFKTHYKSERQKCLIQKINPRKQISKSGIKQDQTMNINVELLDLTANWTWTVNHAFLFCSQKGKFYFSAMQSLCVNK